MDRRSRTSIGVILSAVIAVAAVAGAAAPTVLADEPPAYYLPAPAGTSLLVAQGNGEAAFRSPDERYAFDFAAADGSSPFPVAAARGGTVIAARDGVRGGRCRRAGRPGRVPSAGAMSTTCSSITATARQGSTCTSRLGACPCAPVTS